MPLLLTPQSLINPVHVAESNLGRQRSIVFADGLGTASSSDRGLPLYDGGHNFVGCVDPQCSACNALGIHAKAVGTNPFDAGYYDNTSHAPDGDLYSDDESDRAAKDHVYSTSFRGKDAARPADKGAAFPGVASPTVGATPHTYSLASSKVTASPTYSVASPSGVTLGAPVAATPPVYATATPRSQRVQNAFERVPEPESSEASTVESALSDDSPRRVFEDEPAGLGTRAISFTPQFPDDD